MRGATLAYMTMGLIAVSPLHIAGIVEKKTDENFRKTAQTTFILSKILSVPFFFSCFRNYRLRLLSFWRHLLQGVVGGFDSFLFAVHCCDVFFLVMSLYLARRRFFNEEVGSLCWCLLFSVWVAFDAEESNKKSGQGG